VSWTRVLRSRLVGGYDDDLSVLVYLIGRTCGHERRCMFYTFAGKRGVLDNAEDFPNFPKIGLGKPSHILQVRLMGIVIGVYNSWDPVLSFFKVLRGRKDVSSLYGLDVEKGGPWCRSAG